MEPRAHERGGAAALRLEVSPRLRLPLLALGFLSLVFGMAGGLARLSAFEYSGTAIALHGPLMVSAFFGTVISLERAAALDRLWAYAAPLRRAWAGLFSFPASSRRAFR